MRLLQSNTLLGLALLGAAACGDQREDPTGDDTGIGEGNDSDPGEDETGDSGEDETGDSGDEAGEDEGPGTDIARGRCEASVLGPPTFRRLTRNEIENTILDVFPQISGQWDGVEMGPDPLSSLGFSNGGGNLEVGPQTAKEINRTAEAVADLVTDANTLQNVLSCAGSANTACAEDFIETFGERLFRRPLTSDERSSYVDHFESVADASDFATGIKWTLVALLQSPNTIYRAEVGERDGSTRRLTPNEIASQLSYNFGGSPPSSALLAMAEAGDLDDPATRVEQARQLLATARGQEIVHQFFREWIGYRQVEAETRNDQQFESLRTAMAEETKRFIEQVVYEEDGDVRDLLLADYTVLNQQLASYYGFGSASGDYQVVQRPAEWGVGILAQASFLATNAHAEYSSPTLRGLLVFSRLLCNARPEAPNDVPSLMETEHIEAATTRERYETVHAADPFCQGCHAAFDPLGFAFEHFDQFGRYRATENGNEIDASGSTRIGGQSVEFDGLNDLAQRMADSNTATDCVSGLLSLYTFGGEEVCLQEDARTALAEGEIGLIDFIAELAASDHFVERTAE